MIKIGSIAVCMASILMSQVLMGQMKVNTDVAADNAAITVKGAVVIVSPKTEGQPRTSKVIIAPDGRIKKWLLFIEEGIVTERMCVDTIANWADDVFEDHYLLTDLQVVESYILKNRHLPGIPPGDVLKEEGYELIEMQANFLRKIEELALHQINQQEKMDNLKAQVVSYQAIEKRIAALEYKYGFREKIIKREPKIPVAESFDPVSLERLEPTAAPKIETMQTMSTSTDVVGVNLADLGPGVVLNMSGRMVIVGYEDTSVPDFDTAPTELFCPSCKRNPNGKPSQWSGKDDFLLFVKGGIAAGDWVCRDLAASWADYVFADDYNLMSLKEEKAFIEANHHLPGVPSKDQVSKGYELSGMSGILMGEIEERFLHLISQHAELEVLEEQVQYYTSQTWADEYNNRLKKLTLFIK